MVGTECDDAAIPSHFKKVHTRNFFFDLHVKDKNYKKTKMKGGVGWMGNDRSLFYGNHFSS